MDKEAKFEQFKKQQRLHPEFAGIYADTFLSTPHEMRQYTELLVFKEHVEDEHLAGVLLIQPHTTWRDLRVLLANELGIQCGAEEELVLSRGVRGLKSEDAFGDGTMGEVGPAPHPGQLAAWHHPLCPIQLTQNHKLVYPFFFPGVPCSRCGPTRSTNHNHGRVDPDAFYGCEARPGR